MQAYVMNARSMQLAQLVPCFPRECASVEFQAGLVRLQVQDVRVAWRWRKSKQQFEVWHPTSTDILGKGEEWWDLQPAADFPGAFRLMIPQTSVCHPAKEVMFVPVTVRVSPTMKQAAWVYGTMSDSVGPCRCTTVGGRLSEIRRTCEST